MSKNQCVNDYLASYLSWFISNIPMNNKQLPTEHKTSSDTPIPGSLVLQCPRKSLGGKVLRKKFIPASFEWLVRFSQPAHFMTLVTSLYLAFLFFPREKENHLAPERPSTFTSLLYVACFATHFGTQFWMTFASGLVLFFSLPRHIFGKVQKCLFPKYFMVNSLLSGITLALFIFHHPSSARGELKVQMWTLLLCFLSEFGARLYIVPGLLDALEERMAIEENAGVGMEIGYHNPGPLAYCPHYKQVNKRFRRYHGVCACANVLAMACSTLHLYFLSTRLSSALT